MTQEELGNKLKSLGITTKNYYTKKSFIWDGQPSVGLFERELQEDFYFHNNFDNKIYLLTKETAKANTFEEDEHEGRTKFIVPLSLCKEIETEEPVYVELEDSPHREMTIRDYTAIKWKRPISNKVWLNELIKVENSRNTYPGGGGAR